MPQPVAPDCDLTACTHLISACLRRVRWPAYTAFHAPFVAPAKAGAHPWFSMPRGTRRTETMAALCAAVAGGEQDRPLKLPPEPRLGPGSGAGATVWGPATSHHQAEMCESGRTAIRGLSRPGQGCPRSRIVASPRLGRRKRPIGFCARLSAITGVFSCKCAGSRARCGARFPHSRCAHTGRNSRSSAHVCRGR